MRYCSFIAKGRRHFGEKKVYFTIFLQDRIRNNCIIVMLLENQQLNLPAAMKYLKAAISLSII